MNFKETKLKGFSQKIFWSIFLSSLAILVVSLLFVSRVFTSWSSNEYKDRYSVLSTMIGENIREMEASAETAMLNAALLVKSLDKERLLSTSELKKIAKQTNVTHLFIINKNGRFIRSTNEDPSLIPSLLSFCPAYTNFLSDPAAIDKTPIILPTPEPNPYKFLIIPNSNGTRFISVGLRVDFLASSLRRFQEQDPNIEAIEMYSPNGTLLGSFRPEEVQLVGAPLENILESDDELKETEDALFYSKWTPSSHRQCCQCQTAGNIRNGVYDYLLNIQVSKKSLFQARASLLGVLSLLCIFSVIVSLILSRFISVRLAGRLQNLNKQVKANLNKKDGVKLLESSGADELTELSRSFNQLIEQREEYRKEHVEFERLKKREAVSHIVAQVSHDLQSPVAALKQVSENLEQIKKEDVIRSIRMSARRIDQISKDILSHFEVEDAHSKSSITFVAPVVESIVGEISLAHSNAEDIEIEIPPSLRASVTTISESNLARSLSNLINNAVDAVERKGSGKVFIKVSECEYDLIIMVADTGLGMKEEDLQKVRTSGGTLHEGGHGLGLSFVKSIVSGVGGRLQIDSSWQKGTTITLFLPKTRKPDWLVENIAIPMNSKIVVIDDDPSILDFWKRKLKSWDAEFFDHVPDKVDGDLIIIDQEIHGSKETGLDVISRLERKDRAILSTSFFFSPDIQKRVEELGCRLLPKFLIDHFQIETVDQMEDEGKVDLVLIDDDSMCRDSWALMAKVNDKKLRAYSSYEEFCKDKPDKSVPIYVDKNLSNSVSGYSILMRLHEKGYINLHLTTGECRSEPKPPEYISSIVSKEFPSTIRA